MTTLIASDVNIVITLFSFAFETDLRLSIATLNIILLLIPIMVG
jgi:hypothetical protein